jgi:hypothetical protein
MLVGHFIEDADDGYALRRAGDRIITTWSPRFRVPSQIHIVIRG